PKRPARSCAVQGVDVGATCVGFPLRQASAGSCILGRGREITVFPSRPDGHACRKAGLRVECDRATSSARARGGAPSAQIQKEKEAVCENLVSRWASVATRSRTARPFLEVLRRCWQGGGR